MARVFQTTYSDDYKHRLENRSLALLRQIDGGLPASSFSLPLPCTTSAVKEHLRINDFKSNVKRNNFTEFGSNRFLKNIAEKQPDLYTEIEENTPWEQRAEGSRMKSSYHIEYDHLPEQLTLRPMKNLSKTGKWLDRKYFQRECNLNPPCHGTTGSETKPCTCQLCAKQTGAELDRPARFGCVYAISNIPKSYITSSHWPERDWKSTAVYKTEYRDKIGRLGRILQQEDIHDHTPCTSPSNCHHRFFL
ncbi:uncharacterized protein LOC128730043 [Anopheles nili]|uniref:uncharacterized protein LOC128730043 n=1 Tax=Anopheles nili TaxID=185578 RepID=UPI00237AC33A|nr:uncharacterized protein LOC128730043 [Anopheles nili]